MEVTTIAIIRLSGPINVNGFTAEAQKLHDAGTRNLIVHMSEMTFLSSAGIRALQATARLLGGTKESDAEKGKSGNRQGGALRVQGHVKLYKPREDIQEILDIVGLKGYFEIFTDLDAAIASFQ
ncbi:MAG TPA: STAS domain-containing protein [Anaerolineales bacterium]|nr:STAS domain-containing protein [Anaerolineales bacterium]